MIRPSYVLGGRAMAIVHDRIELKDYMDTTLAVLVPSSLKAKFPADRTAQINAMLGESGLLVDSYLQDATEVDVDAVADGQDAFVAASWSTSRSRRAFRRQRLHPAPALAER